jgi:hypothetical protein
MFLHRLPKRCDASYCFRIVCGQAAEHTDPPHALGLLRTTTDRPYDRDTAEERQKLSPSHCLPEAQDRAFPSLI